MRSELKPSPLPLSVLITQTATWLNRSPGEQNRSHAGRPDQDPNLSKHRIHTRQHRLSESPNKFHLTIVPSQITHCRPLLTTHQSIYSMSVLPASANLTSYFIVLTITAILTLIAAIILQKNSSITAEIKPQHSPSSPSSSTPTEHFRSLLKSAIHLRTETWKSLSRSTFRLRLFLKDVNRETYKATDNKFVFPLAFLLIFILYGFFSVVKGLVKGIKYLLWDFPWNELGYTFDLLYRPPASVLNRRWFSVRKLVFDLARFVLLPVWLALVLVRGFFTLVFLVLWGCYELLQRCVS
jgi:hypothetical protein